MIKAQIQNLSIKDSPKTIGENLSINCIFDYIIVPTKLSTDDGIMAEQENDLITRR